MKILKYISHLFLAVAAAFASYLGLSKSGDISYMKFNLDDSLYVHADDPGGGGGSTSVDTACASCSGGCSSGGDA